MSPPTADTSTTGVSANGWRQGAAALQLSVFKIKSNPLLPSLNPVCADFFTELSQTPHPFVPASMVAQMSEGEVLLIACLL